jgi:hypothetical protein
VIWSSVASSNLNCVKRFVSRVLTDELHLRAASQAIVKLLSSRCSPLALIPRHRHVTHPQSAPSTSHSHAALSHAMMISRLFVLPSSWHAAHTESLGHHGCKVTLLIARSTRIRRGSRLYTVPPRRGASGMRGAFSRLEPTLRPRTAKACRRCTEQQIGATRPSSRSCAYPSPSLIS